MFINIGACDTCGQFIYIPLISTKPELLYSCKCNGKDDRVRLYSGMIQQQTDMFREFGRRVERMLVKN